MELQIVEIREERASRVKQVELSKAFRNLSGRSLADRKAGWLTGASYEFEPQHAISKGLL